MAAMLIRPAPSEESATFSPSPSAPRRFAAGTTAPSKTSSAGHGVADAHLALVPANAEARRVGRSTTKAVIPSRPSERSTVAKTMVTSDSWPFVIQILVPVRR